jgi:hypothetical protein
MALGTRCVGDPVLTQVALAAAGAASGRLDTVAVTPLAHRVENLTTSRLVRVTGRLADGTAWSAVAKTLHPASEAPAFASIPEEHHQQVLEDLHWLDEPDVYRSGLAEQLPPPLRMPRLYAVQPGGDASLTLWLEDVDDVAAWDLARYRRTATALGTMAGRWRGDEAAARFGLGSRDIARLFFGKVVHVDLRLQSSDEFWSDPMVAAVTDHRHREDLRRLAEAMPRLLADLAAVPTGVCHGDATPDNFREPGDGSVVALDWSYGHVGAVGSDLGQLLAGRCESGAAAPEDIDAIAATVFEGYCEGLDAAGHAVDPRLVEHAWCVHLAIRSAFSALLLDHRPDLVGDDRLDLLVRRARLARFAIDLALRRTE